MGRERDYWVPSDGGLPPLPEERVGGYPPNGDRDLPDSPTLLDCERCGGIAATDAADARSKTSGWLEPLFCRPCEVVMFGA